MQITMRMEELERKLREEVDKADAALIRAAELIWREGGEEALRRAGHDPAVLKQSVHTAGEVVGAIDAEMQRIWPEERPKTDPDFEDQEPGAEQADGAGSGDGR